MQLQRSIGLVGLTFVAISGIVGSGWLFAPLMTSEAAGPAAIISWVIGGAAMLVLAICFAEVTGVLPVAGGIARLPHFTHGDVTSSVLGWSAWVGYNTAVPIETIAMLEYLGKDIPWLFVGSPSDGNLSIAGCFVAAACLAFLMAINAMGVAALAKANTLISFVKLIVPVTVAVAIMATRFDTSNFTSAGFAPNGPEGIFEAVSRGGIIFALIGFRHAIDLAGEVKRPQVTVPIALTLALIACVGIYLLLQVAFVGALSTEQVAGGWNDLQFAHRMGPIAAIAAALGITWLAAFIYTGAVVAPLGGGLVAMGSTARIGFALARNGFFPQFFEKLSDRGVPFWSLLVNLGFGILLVIFIPFKEAVALNSAAITISFCGGPLAVMALREQMPDAPRPFRLPAGPWIAAVGFCVATLIVYWSGWHTAWRLGLIVLVGLILFAVKMRRDRVKMADLDLRESLWLLPYGLGIGLISYLGAYDGLGVLAYPWDLVVTALFSLGIFWFAHRCRLADETAERYRNQYSTLPPPETTPL